MICLSLLIMTCCCDSAFINNNNAAVGDIICLQFELIIHALNTICIKALRLRANKLYKTACRIPTNVFLNSFSRNGDS